jgi:hypothetical protein
VWLSSRADGVQRRDASQSRQLWFAVISTTTALTGLPWRARHVSRHSHPPKVLRVVEVGSLIHGHRRPDSAALTEHDLLVRRDRTVISTHTTPAWGAEHGANLQGPLRMPAPLPNAHNGKYGRGGRLRCAQMAFDVSRSRQRPAQMNTKGPSWSRTLQGNSTSRSSSQAIHCRKLTVQGRGLVTTALRVQARCRVTRAAAVLKAPPALWAQPALL